MGNLRTRFERSCFKNRDKGIPNLMLYIVLGNALVVLLSMFNGGNVLYNLLCFDKARILKGEVWRLFTYVFTQSEPSMIELIFMYFFYMLGRHVEQSMGTFRFNLYYFSGVILMDIFAMLFAPVQAPYFLVYYRMAYYLHLSLLLTFATMYPDSHFMLLMIIPIKAWILAVVYLVLVAAEIFNMSFPNMYFPHNLFPLVAMGNYLLFAGSGIKNLLPAKWRMVRRKKATSKNAEPIQFRPIQRSAPKREDFTHKCTVCGRTDVSNPELEFRYCSRCNGYHCYCQEHINNHTHIE